MIRRRLAGLRYRLGAPMRSFRNWEAEDRSQVLGLALITTGILWVGPAFYVPGFLLAAVGFRQALPFGHPIVTATAIGAATLITIAVVGFR